MLIGDSVLMSQYLALAQELQAAPAEAGLSTFAPCTDPAYSNMWPTQPAVMNLATVAHEYLLTCGAAGCAFGRLGCMHFYARACGLATARRHGTGCGLAAGRLRGLFPLGPEPPGLAEGPRAPADLPARRGALE